MRFILGRKGAYTPAHFRVIEIGFRALSLLSTRYPRLSEFDVQVESESYYRRLGLHKDASEVAIKKAYRKLALRYHPGESLRWCRSMHA